MDNIKNNTMKNTTLEICDHVHQYFGLSYAQYLVLPRTVLQSLPKELQLKFITLMEEIDETIDWMPENGTYRVQLMTTKENSKFETVWDKVIPDPNADYQRGRRKLDLKS